ncbi:hypothetical protein HK101_009632 [Irineochytrium annulatum]|nr:hypothetical protein HK101_009632 [Irineochytrium annulatum]
MSISKHLIDGLHLEKGTADAQPLVPGRRPSQAPSTDGREPDGAIEVPLGAPKESLDSYMKKRTTPRPPSEEPKPMVGSDSEGDSSADGVDGEPVTGKDRAGEDGARRRSLVDGGRQRSVAEGGRQRSVAEGAGLPGSMASVAAKGIAGSITFTQENLHRRGSNADGRRSSVAGGDFDDPDDADKPTQHQAQMKQPGQGLKSGRTSQMSSLQQLSAKEAEEKEKEETAEAADVVDPNAVPINPVTKEPWDIDVSSAMTPLQAMELHAMAKKVKMGLAMVAMRQLERSMDEEGYSKSFMDQEDKEELAGLETLQTQIVNHFKECNIAEDSPLFQQYMATLEIKPPKPPTPPRHVPVEKEHTAKELMLVESYPKPVPHAPIAGLYEFQAEEEPDPIPTEVKKFSRDNSVLLDTKYLQSIIPAPDPPPEEEEAAEVEPPVIEEPPREPTPPPEPQPVPEPELMKKPPAVLPPIHRLSTVKIGARAALQTHVFEPMAISAPLPAPVVASLTKATPWQTRQAKMALIAAQQAAAKESKLKAAASATAAAAMQDEAEQSPASSRTLLNDARQLQSRQSQSRPSQSRPSQVLSPNGYREEQRPLSRQVDLLDQRTPSRQITYPGGGGGKEVLTYAQRMAMTDAHILRSREGSRPQQSQQPQPRAAGMGVVGNGGANNAVLNNSPYRKPLQHAPSHAQTEQEEHRAPPEDHRMVFTSITGKVMTEVDMRPHAQPPKINAARELATRPAPDDGGALRTARFVSGASDAVAIAKKITATEVAKRAVGAAGVAPRTPGVRDPAADASYIASMARDVRAPGALEAAMKMADQPDRSLLSRSERRSRPSDDGRTSTQEGGRARNNAHGSNGSLRSSLIDIDDATNATRTGPRSHLRSKTSLLNNPTSFATSRSKETLLPPSTSRPQLTQQQHQPSLLQKPPPGINKLPASILIQKQRGTILKGSTVVPSQQPSGSGEQSFEVGHVWEGGGNALGESSGRSQHAPSKGVMRLPKLGKTYLDPKEKKSAGEDTNRMARTLRLVGKGAGADGVDR